jgi:hypothetical protein
MDWKDRIAIDPAVLVGEPVAKGTRLAVQLVVELLAQGVDRTRATEQLPGTDGERHSRAGLSLRERGAVGGERVRRASSFFEPLVDVATMPDRQDKDDERTIAHFVHDAVVANANAPGVDPRELLRPRRPWLHRERVDLGRDPLTFACGELRELLRGRRDEVDSVAHALRCRRSAEPQIALDRFPGNAPLLLARPAYGDGVLFIFQRADPLEDREVLGGDDRAEDFAAAFDDDPFALERDALEDIGKLRPGLAGGETSHLVQDVRTDPLVQADPAGSAAVGVPHHPCAGS